MESVKVCPLCGKKNSSSFSHCQSCKHDLAVPVPEAERQVCLLNRRPAGVTFFIVLAILQTVITLATLPLLKPLLKDYGWQTLLLLAFNITFWIVVIIGLAKGKEWGRKAAIVLLVLVPALHFVQPRMPESRPASQEAAFQSFKHFQEKKLVRGRRAAFTEESLRQEFKARMDRRKKRAPFIFTLVCIFNLLWVYYFAFPARKYFQRNSVLIPKTD